MKLILLSLFTVAVLFQTGCASRPSIDEQSRKAQEDAETVTKSDAFAKQLAQ
jgi:hypothetical protein